MRCDYINLFLSTLSLPLLVLLLGFPLIAQPVATDDFYVVDSSQYINTYENDLNYAGGWDWTLVVPPAHGGAGPTCQIGFGCCRYCTYFNPVGNYTGFDVFQYRYTACCGAPPETPPSNIATVFVLLIGNDDAQNAGSCPVPPIPSAPVPPIPSPNVGLPVNVTNGNMWLEQTDYVLPGVGERIEINRFYNSIIQTSGLFGFGWSTKYDESLQIYPDNKMIRLNAPDGRASYFGRSNTANPFTSFSPYVTGQIVKNGDGTYTFTYKDRRVHKFNASGRLLWQKDQNGNQTTLNYDVNSGYLTSITDASNRTLTLTRFTNQLVVSDAIGTVATYDYVPGTSLLQTVTYPDGSKYKFEYAPPINGKTYLATVKDALDKVLETHAYDPVSGKATTSEKEGGVEKYIILHDQSDSFYGAFTRVTDGLGRVTKYFFQRRYAQNLVTRTDGACGGCGGSGSEITQYFYDDRLNLVKKTDALNRNTVYTYDSNRNVTAIRDVYGIQKYTYDSFNSFGEVLTYKDRIDSQPGSTATTAVMTYDNNGNPLTYTDANGKTTSIEYPATNNRGLPNSVKDARNNFTKFK